ncbi:MAG: hypothetical protein ACXVCE_07620 [Bacteriovorax sp.]
MKKFILSAMVFLSLSTSVFAFVPQMSFYVNREVATARVWNYTGRPFVCSGTAYGQTFSGVVLNAWFNQIYVAPDMYADAYVYSNYYDPFSRAWAQVDCQFAW